MYVYDSKNVKWESFRFHLLEQRILVHLGRSMAELMEWPLPPYLLPGFIVMYNSNNSIEMGEYQISFVGAKNFNRSQYGWVVSLTIAMATPSTNLIKVACYCQGALLTNYVPQSFQLFFMTFWLWKSKQHCMHVYSQCT